MRIESGPAGAWPESRPAGAHPETGQSAWKPLPEDPESRPSADGEGQPDPGSEAAPKAPPSSAKSLTYGILGVERPDHPEEPPNTPYETGQWIGAATRIGAILSLLL